ncbi:YiaA/YiaB family inner membrane protein [Spartinivicinus poritis]|uniref:YiaA/YiaB family inner membrane protein n=1 Tax=Spartinivicinus poritis TaxID=2994640 RepID=A0ABT5UAY7_9GAMM|nr:YiaA/YiaB family inner membrane protein [Spartinivicinus sp. A2-2]MDE1463541.1 YiaA/YiaB family inner membrane protein [Spartinivicinus sp. A2-2]
MDYSDLQGSSQSWVVFVKISFVLSIAAMLMGILIIPASLEIKGYLVISALFIINSTITLSKTLRDEHEKERLINKISTAKTQKIINEFTD